MNFSVKYEMLYLEKIWIIRQSFDQSIDEKLWIIKVGITLPARAQW